MTEHILPKPELSATEASSIWTMWTPFGQENVTSRVVQRLSFADVVLEDHVRLGDLAESAKGEWEIYSAVDGDNRLEFEDAQQQLLFEQVDVGIEAFDYYVQSLKAVDSIAEHMPTGGLADGFKIATKAKINKLLSEQRRINLDPQSSPESIEKLRYAQRDLLFGLHATASALLLGTGDYLPDGSRAWYTDGHKSRNGGYNALYTVCNDEYSPDASDHADAFVGGDDDGWTPDEFHNPGKLEIRVDPAARIEFVYTPEIDSARSRHSSHSAVTQHGVQKIYNNQSLSIRIDLDPTAPNGVALDVGRSAYDGGKDGRYIKRDADLLGSVYGNIEDQGSHEYSGFDETAQAEFRNFAERIAVQLDLQKKEIKSATLGKVALSKAA